MDDLGKLLLFRDVVDAGGFSHAARRRGLSHSTVSKHIKSLEEHLGFQLLQRTSRTMKLTDAGTLTLAHCRHVGASVAQLHERLDELRGEVVGELRVGSLVHLGRHLVQPAVARFLEEYPRARVDLVLDDGPLHFTQDGFDAAIRVGLPTEGSLTASKLLKNDVCVVAAPSLIARLGLPEHPEALRDYPAVSYRSGTFDISTWNYREDGAFRSVTIAPSCIVNDGNALLDLALAGVGIAYVSALAAKEHLRSGALVSLFADDVFPPFDSVFLLHAATAHPSLKLLAFRRHLRAVAASLEGSNSMP